MTKKEFLSAINELISSITYKPGWHFTWHDARDEEVMVYIEAPPQPSAHGQNNEVTIRFPLGISYDRVSLANHDKRAVEDLIKPKIVALVESIELHESREWLQVNGVSITPAHGPHGEFLPLTE